ncbi:NAD(P)-binding protein [Niabella ginsenosidivorans]|nr:NAD(P)-binding protein [Niabella ginsenosidivorans]
MLSAGALALPGVIPARPYPSKKPGVIIIGAGLAGLAAAYRLKKKDTPITIIESRSIITGVTMLILTVRMQSISQGNGLGCSRN